MYSSTYSTRTISKTLPQYQLVFVAYMIALSKNAAILSWATCHIKVRIVYNSKTSSCYTFIKILWKNLKFDFNNFIMINYTVNYIEKVINSLSMQYYTSKLLYWSTLRTCDPVSSLLIVSKSNFIQFTSHYHCTLRTIYYCQYCTSLRHQQ